MNDDRATVLYVEDDPDFREAVTTVMEAGGYRVVQASSGEEGLRVFQAEDPDVVLVDLMMEEVDAGTNLVRELRARGQGLPVFILSSLGDELHRSRDLRSLGVTGVLQKPVRGEALLALLSSVLGEAGVGG